MGLGNEEKGKIKVLLIEDNPGDARLVREILSGIEDSAFELQHADRLQTGLKMLAGEEFDIVLLDLGLPDSSGMETLTRVHEQALDVPIIALTGNTEKLLGRESVREGAQDFLQKGKVDSDLMYRSIHYAIERQRVMGEVRSLSLVDELTGLYNRRGFLTLGEQQMKVAARLNKGVVLLFLDLDKMKEINDKLGHQQGDAALIEVANVLKSTFRESDVIARVGGDEFVVLAVKSREDNIEVLVARLQDKLNASNADGDGGYKLSVSVGMAGCEAGCSPSSIDELLSRADKLMYEQKQVEKRP